MPNPDHVLMAPSGRAPIDEVRRQKALVEANAGVRLLDELPLGAIVVNAQRQIVYANRALAALLEVDLADDMVGLRFGEAARCAHSGDTPMGCGTTEFCTTCGAAQALLTTAGGRDACQECRIISPPLGDLELRVWTRPFTVDTETFTLFTAMDIRDENRRATLERIFFHDVMNTAGGIQGLARTLVAPGVDASGENEEVIATIADLATQLVDELESQQDLVAMERGDLFVRPAPVRTLEILRGVVDGYRHRDIAADRLLVIAADAQNASFISDARLLRRVIGNMTKNALEASAAGETVTLSCDRDVDRVRFSVHNRVAMRRDVQLKLFQRSFSTKGSGRGVGTYSMRLLSECYLSGRISFTSTIDGGTTFVAEYPRMWRAVE